jgi:DNA repair exonuclease SbcCD ATPase subunit
MLKERVYAVNVFAQEPQKTAPITATETSSTKQSNKTKTTQTSQPSTKKTAANTKRNAPEHIQRMIDVANNAKAQSSPGYVKWAQGFNLQTAAKTLMFLQQNKLTDMDELAKKLKGVNTKYNATAKKVSELDNILKNISSLQIHISNYSRGKAAYAEWKQLKTQDTQKAEKFYAENQSTITNVEAAKRAFDKLNLKTLPTIAALKQDYAKFDAEKKSLYTEFNATKKERSELLTVKENLELFLNVKLSDIDAQNENEIENPDNVHGEVRKEQPPTTLSSRKKKLSSER